MKENTDPKYLRAMADLSELKLKCEKEGRSPTSKEVTRANKLLEFVDQQDFLNSRSGRPADMPNDFPGNTRRLSENRKSNLTFH